MLEFNQGNRMGDGNPVLTRMVTCDKVSENAVIDTRIVQQQCHVRIDNQLASSMMSKPGSAGRLPASRSRYRAVCTIDGAQL